MSSMEAVVMIVALTLGMIGLVIAGEKYGSWRVKRIIARVEAMTPEQIHAQVAQAKADVAAEEAGS